MQWSEGCVTAWIYLRFNVSKVSVYFFRLSAAVVSTHWKFYQLLIGVNFELKMDVTENSKLKRRIRALERENKRLKQDNEIDKIIQTVNKIHKALKPRYVRLDELVRNSGLQHIAQNIFQHLDLPTLSRCRQVSSSWKICIDNDKYWWKKLLKHKSFIWTGNGMDLPDLVETLNYICAKETLANMKELLGVLRDANTTIRWIMLHEHTSNPVMKQIVQSIVKSGGLVRLLLKLSKFEHLLKELVT